MGARAQSVATAGPVRDGRRRSVPDAFAVVAPEIAGRRIAAALDFSGTAGVRRYTSLEDLLRGPRPDAAADLVVVYWERLAVECVRELDDLWASRPETLVVGVASSFARPALSAALDAGLSGLVHEAELDACLPLAVNAALMGHVVLPKELCAIATRPAFSAREKQILALVVMGFSNAEIAKKLFITESTVKSHLSSAFARLGVRSRRQATALILDPEQGLGTGILAISGNERQRGPG